MQRRHRLRADADFRRVRRCGRSWGHSLLVLYAARPGAGAPPEHGAPTRVGVTVGRGVGGAVVRNRVRRRIREAVRVRYDCVAPGWDLVFVARGASAEAGGDELARAVETLLARAGLLTGEP